MFHVYGGYYDGLANKNQRKKVFIRADLLPANQKQG
jgi:hypothetical protein